MKLKDQLSSLKQNDIYSLMLFALFKLKNIPEYSTLSELIYILDKDSLLKLCEYFGGQYIKIPTIDELESMVYALVLYEYVELKHLSYDDSISMINQSTENLKEIISLYKGLKEVLSNYEFNPR